ncbi:MAG: hypothetical protein OHK0038_17260 [Flammeovirgaceae bacterium]
MKNLFLHYLTNTINQIQTANFDGIFLVLIVILVFVLFFVYYFYFKNKSNKNTQKPDTENNSPQQNDSILNQDLHDDKTKDKETIFSANAPDKNNQNKETFFSQHQTQNLINNLNDNLDVPLIVQQWISKEDILKAFNQKYTSFLNENPQNLASESELFLSFLSKINENLISFAKELENDKENVYQFTDLKQQGFLLEKIEHLFSESNHFKELILDNFKKVQPTYFYDNLQKFRLVNEDIEQKLKVYLNLREENENRIEKWEQEKNNITQFLLKTKTIWEKLQTYPFSNFAGLENHFQNAAKQIDLSFSHFDNAIDLHRSEYSKSEQVFEELNVSYSLFQDAKSKLQAIIDRYENIQRISFSAKMLFADVEKQLESSRKETKYKNEDFELRLEICERNLKEAEICIKSQEFIIAQDFAKKAEENLLIAKEIAHNLNSKIKEMREKLEKIKRKVNDEIELVQQKIPILKSQSVTNIDEKVKNTYQSLEEAQNAEAKVDLSNYLTAEKSLKLAILRYEQTYRFANEINFK